jgi:glycosyltransferase involved in cell wall biosynthesis
MTLRLSVIVCAHNESRYISGCLHSLLSQTRPPDEIVVVDNASVDDTGATAAAIPGVLVIEEPRKGLVQARETGRLAATGDVLVYLDADCRAPIEWLARIEDRFRRDPDLIGLSGPYRFYDWDWSGRVLIRLYDYTLAPLTQVMVKHVLGIGTVFYGGNFAVRATALIQIKGFDTRIEFHGEDTNLGRRLNEIGKVSLFLDCYLHTSARRYVALGKWAVIRLYVRNFVSEVVRHRPSDVRHVDVRN